MYNTAPLSDETLPQDAKLVGKKPKGKKRNRTPTLGREMQKSKEGLTEPECSLLGDTIGPVVEEEDEKMARRGSLQRSSVLASSRGIQTDATVAIETRLNTPDSSTMAVTSELTEKMARRGLTLAEGAVQPSVLASARGNTRIREF